MWLPLGVPDTLELGVPVCDGVVGAVWLELPVGVLDALSEAIMEAEIEGARLLLAVLVEVAACDDVPVDVVLLLSEGVALPMRVAVKV